MLDRISHHSLSTRFDMYQPILEKNLDNMLKESKYQEKSGRVPIESGLKIPIPRLGWMGQLIKGIVFLETKKKAEQFQFGI